MGNFEKLVVLTVLFLAAIILGVSLHDDGVGQSNDPLSNMGGPENVTEVAVMEPETSTQPINSALLSSTAELKPKTESKTPVTTPKTEPKTAPKAEPKVTVAAPARSLFKTMSGLTKPVFGDDYMIYTWKSGDTIASVASTYYGDRNKRYLIRNNNEGSAFLVGDDINLPAYDAAAGAGEREAFKPAPEHKAPVKKPVAKKPSKAVHYTVLDGDSLWSIAKDAYGKGTKWEQIFKANRDQLDDASDLKPGMELRIP